MPPAIPIIAAVAAVAADAGAAAGIGAITIAGVTISASTVGAIVGSLAALAVTFVGTAIFGQKANSADNSADATNRSVLVRSPVSPHQVIVGTIKVSGTLVYDYSPALARVGYASAVFGYAEHDFAPY